MSSVTSSPQDSADSAGVLQLFLETYFMELLGEVGEKSLDGDQQQVKLFALREGVKKKLGKSDKADRLG